MESRQSLFGYDPAIVARDRALARWARRAVVVLAAFALFVAGALWLVARGPSPVVSYGPLLPAHALVWRLCLALPVSDGEGTGACLMQADEAYERVGAGR